MVEDRITDGKRIAELLASELSARETGPLAAVSVVDAEPSAEPSADGTPAYSIAVEGTPIGVVSLFPDYVRVTLTDDAGIAVDVAPNAGIPARRENDEAVLRVESGTAVKRTADVIAAVAEA